MSGAGSVGNIIQGATTLIGGLAAGASMLKGTPKAPKAEPIPQLKPPAQAPTMDDAAVAEARRRAVVARMTGGGRESTILSDTLGG